MAHVLLCLIAESIDVSSCIEKWSYHLGQIRKELTENLIPTPADVTGIMMPYNWNKNGRITEIAIYTGTEEVYGVEPNRLAQEIMKNFMHRRIAVRGRISEDPDANMTIAIKKFSILEEIIDEEKKGN